MNDIDRIKAIIKQKEDDIKLLEEVLKIKYIDGDLKQNIKHEIHALNTQMLVINDYALELGINKLERLHNELKVDEMEGLSEV